LKRLQFLFEKRLEGFFIPSHELVRRADPEIAVRVFGDGSRIGKVHSAVAADAPWALAHHLA
jgi:hypothetical protein